MRLPKDVGRLTPVNTGVERGNDLTPLGSRVGLYNRLYGV